jgi:hypothetical protein
MIFLYIISKKSGLGLTFAAMANDTNKFQAIISHCKEYGFIFPAAKSMMGCRRCMTMAKWVVS